MKSEMLGEFRTMDVSSRSRRFSCSYSFLSVNDINRWDDLNSLYNPHCSYLLTAWPSSRQEIEINTFFGLVHTSLV